MMRFRTLASATIAALMVSTSLVQAAEFKIGVAMGLTGAAAPAAEIQVKGMQAAIAVVNARGGIGGMPAKLVICDTQTVEQQAVLCARRLLFDDQVNLLLGTGNTPQTLAILPTVEQAGVPTFAVAGGTVTFRPLKKWVFKAVATNDDLVRGALQYAKAKGYKTLANIRDSGATGSDVAAVLKVAAEEFGLEVVAEETYAPTDTDMTAQLTRIRAANPDVIINMASTSAPGAIIAKKIVQLGMKQPIMVSTILQSPSYIQLAGPEAAAQTAFVGYKATVADESSSALGANFAAFKSELAKADPEAKIVGLTLTGVDGILLAQAAAKDLGEKALDPVELLRGLESLKAVPGMQGEWTFSADNHETSLLTGMTVLKHSDGNWVEAE